MHLDFFVENNYGVIVFGPNKSLHVHKNIKKKKVDNYTTYHRVPICLIIQYRSRICNISYLFKILKC